jgi:hypothetical protein
MFRAGMPENDTPLGLHYHRDRPEGHDFIDLKAEPERWQELPELKRSATFSDVVLTITKQTVLQTLGCEFWMNDSSRSPWPEQPEYSFQVGSYVDLAFTDPRKMSRDAYSQLMNDFVKSKTAKPTTQVGLQHKTIVVHSQSYLGMIWWNWGFGRTHQEAETSWAFGIQLFKEFVLERYPAMQGTRGENANKSTRS